ncbi:MAG: zinc-dependent metalloprotease [Pseudomonadota bacterium]
MRHARHFMRVGLFAVMALWLVACATEVGDIDRTEPDKIKKSDLRGVWYMVMTVVDAPVPTPFTFNGEMNFGGGVKVIFDIQEDYLIAYPISEVYIEGAEKPWKKSQIRNYWDEGKSDEFLEIYVGQPVAAYKITSHFDVIRRYNAATGDQDNVIVEDSKDKYWYQREYLRVDWSDTAVADLMFLASVDSNDVDYFVQEYEVDNPDAFEMTEDSINFVTKLHAQPASASSCSIYGIAPYDCAGAVIKSRTSFRKVDPNNEYIPLRYPEYDHQERFGFFLTEKYGYDVNNGMTLEGKVWLANRWDLWQNSRTADPIPDPETEEMIPCTWDEDCEGLHEGGQTHCLVEDWWAEGHCVTWDTLPYGQRTPKPIVYHMNTTWPKQLLRTAYSTSNEYSSAYGETVAWLKLYSEKGLVDTRYCETNADCAIHAIWDGNLTSTHGKPCVADADCKLGVGESIQHLFSCQASVCAQKQQCQENIPCPLGQVCKANICEDAGGPVFSTVEQTGAYTVFLSDQDGALTHHVSQDEKMTTVTGQVLIRVVNLTQSKDIQIEGPDGALCSGATFRYPSTELFVAPECNIAPSADPVQFTATAGGTTLATLKGVTLEAANVYTFVFTGVGGSFDLFVTEATHQDLGGRGVRFVHGAMGHGGVDFSLNGSLRTGDVRYAQGTDYTGSREGTNRVVLVRTGDKGDITCYSDHGIGMCTGWRTELTQEDMTWVEEIAADLPMMFAVCENIWNGDHCRPSDDDPDFVVDRTVWNDCRYWWYDEGMTTWRNPCAEVPAPGAIKKHGDIRYNFIYWIGEDQTASPLGYGPSAADPDTGEIYHGIANLYGGPMVTYSQYAKDLLDLATGEISPEDAATGKYIKEYIEAHPPAGTYDSLHAELADPTHNRDWVRAKAQENIARRPPLRRTWMTPEENELVRLQIQSDFTKKVFTDPEFAQKAMYEGLPEGLDPVSAKARMSKIQGTWIEDLMINNEVVTAFEAMQQTGDAMLPGAVDTAQMSPLSWGSKDFIKAENERLNKLAENNYYSVDALESAEANVLGTALKIRAYCSDEANWVEYDATTTDECEYWEMTQQMMDGVTLHEVGHIVGLRHNFIASADAHNFQDEYYSLREPGYRKCEMEGENGCVFFNQTCKLECLFDTDCLQPGSACVATEIEGVEKTLCMDQHGDPAGTCYGYRPQFSYCKADSECIDALGYDAANVRCMKSVEQRFGRCGAKIIKDATSGACGAGLIADDKGFCIKDDTCNTATKTCQKDGAVACAADADCQAVFQVVQSDPVLTPIFGLEPRAELTQGEAESGRTEYQYSSLMDYGGTTNFDLHGLGKYDVAAIKFGYGELIEAYTDKRQLEQALIDVNAVWSNDTLEQTSDFVYDTEIHAYLIFHQFLTLNDFIGVKENMSRINVPYQKARLEYEMILSWNRGLYDRTYFIVPYKARYDGWRGSFSTYVWDLGVDFLEILNHSWSKLHDYYVFDAFKRERLWAYQGGDPMGYYNRILTRWLPPLQDAGRMYGLYWNMFRAYPEARVLYFNNRDAMGVVREAADYAMSQLFTLLASPAPGSYVLVDGGTPKARYVNFSYDTGAEGSQLDIPLGDGKFPYTSYYKDAGYYAFDHAMFIGSFWEKVAALQTLTDSTGYFIGDYIGEQVDVGVGTSIGFNTTYYTAMTNTIAGMMVDDMTHYGPYVEDGVVRAYDFLHPWEAEGLPKVMPSVDGISFKAYLGTYGFTYIPGGFDPGFVDSLRICLEGNGSCYEMFEGQFAPEVVNFTDPWSKKTYRAWTSNYDTSRINAAYDLLGRANGIKVLYEEYEWGASPETDITKAEYEEELHRIVELADMIYTLGELFGELNY